MNATEAIDLCNDTPPPVAAMPLTARHPPSAAAARRKPARDVINLLNDASSSDHSTSQTQGGGTAAAKKKRAYKTDPNERDDDDSDAVELLGSASKKTRYDAVVVVEKQQPPLGPELQILEVFPDIDAEALQTLLQQFQNNVPQVLSYMAENSYKKSEKKASAAQKPDLSLHMGGDGAVWKYDYLSTESFEPTRDYIQQATEHLLSEFKFLSKLGAQNILQKCKNHYAVSHDKIIAAIKGTTGDEDAQYDRLVAALDGRGRKVPSDLTERTRQICDQRCRSPTLKKPRKQSFKVAVSNAILKQEIRFVKNKLLEYMETQSKRRKRLKAQEEAQKQGTAVECSCCFDSYPFDDMVACREEGHLFCSDCLKMYAENQVFGQGNLGIDKRSKQPALELLCCYGGDNGCSSGFDRHYLEKALPPKTLKKYDEVQFTVTVQRAGLSTVCSCPKCGFQADVPETQKVFQCPVAECGYASCRECGEAAHIPLRCEEVEKEVQTKGRLTVEEAITEAVIRKCPKCKKPIIKSDGCNKIRCACGAYMCYLCQRAIRDYTHFCQTPHCTHQKGCRKCPLYTKAEEDDARAMRAAGYAAAEEVKKQSAQNAAVNNNNKKEAEVDVDVESILRTK